VSGIVESQVNSGSDQGVAVRPAFTLSPITLFLFYPQLNTMPGMDFKTEIEKRLAVIGKAAQDLREYHPRAVILFGSMARCLAGVESQHIPSDIDLMVIGDNPPLGVEGQNDGYIIELHRFMVYQFVDIARSLRYDSKPVALSKLYGSVLAKRHAKNVIAACLLLGPSYNDFGIQQIEVDAVTDKRDYSIHSVLVGREWWRRISAYARERRGPIKRFSDKLVSQFEFDG
jgi:predicted nucleotidyltransferase